MDVMVAGSSLVLVDPLVVNDWLMCATAHILTPDEVDSLERDSTSIVSAKDVSHFEVSVPNAELVELNQVRTTVWVVICRIDAPGRRVVGCGRCHVGQYQSRRLMTRGVRGGERQ